MAGKIRRPVLDPKRKRREKLKTCPGCSDLIRPDELSITRCKHSFCGYCFATMQRANISCPICGLTGPTYTVPKAATKKTKVKSSKPAIKSTVKAEKA